MPEAEKVNPEWVRETKDWRMGQSAQTGLICFVQIQGIYREIPETRAPEI
jgi:hypothetical protein